MPLGQPADVFERCYTESLAQAASHCLALLLRNHEVLPGLSILS